MGAEVRHLSCGTGCRRRSLRTGLQVGRLVLSHMPHALQPADPRHARSHSQSLSRRGGRTHHTLHNGGTAVAVWKGYARKEAVLGSPAQSGEGESGCAHGCLSGCRRQRAARIPSQPPMAQQGHGAMDREATHTGSARRGLRTRPVYAPCGTDRVPCRHGGSLPLGKSQPRAKELHAGVCRMGGRIHTPHAPLSLCHQGARAGTAV